MALLALLIIPVVLGTALAVRARSAPDLSPQGRDAMYLTAFGFAPSSVTASGETPPARNGHRAPTVLVVSLVPFAASGILAAFAAPHQVKQLWTFSCRLFGH